MHWFPWHLPLQQLVGSDEHTCQFVKQGAVGAGGLVGGLVGGASVGGLVGGTVGGFVGGGFVGGDVGPLGKIETSTHEVYNCAVSSASHLQERRVWFEEKFSGNRTASRV